ncbi:hypothetical protein SUGI_0094730 [Cryptomeria japonica]|nr:hypothetical protein SUGI_0094730 [Cryptomeria japonica]
MAYVLVLFFIALSAATDYSNNGAYIQYNTTAASVEDKINVYLVPHSHDVWDGSKLLINTRLDTITVFRSLIRSNLISL